MVIKKQPTAFAWRYGLCLSDTPASLFIDIIDIFSITADSHAFVPGNELSLGGGD
jgi:hypothetical protein